MTRRTEPAGVALTEGQALYFVWNNNQRSATEVTVVKVGRKWAELSNRFRVRLDTLFADGGEYSSPGRAWLSKADYDAETERQGAWSDFRRHVERRYGPPDALTTADIRGMSAILAPPGDTP